MKLLYATSIRFPSALANRIQVISMAKAFGGILGHGFFLGGNEIRVPDSNYQVVNFGVKKSWKLAWKVLNFARSAGITHLYAREARLLFFIVFYNTFYFRLPLVFGYEVHALLGRSSLDYLTDKFLTLFVHHYFFTTGQLQKIYSRKYRLKVVKSLVLPDAVDLSIFDLQLTKAEARKHFGWSEEEKIVGFCGRFKTLTMAKGLDDILEALKLLPSDVRLVAVGGSDEDIAEYTKKAESLSLGSRTTFFGHVSQRDLAVYQKTFDILLMPFPRQTHFVYYMSPLKMFEYMAAKRPIIATNLPSICEVLNERNAMLVPPGDPKKLATAIAWLYRDPSLGEKLADQAYLDVQNYTWQKRAEKIISTIKTAR